MNEVFENIIKRLEELHDRYVDLALCYREPEDVRRRRYVAMKVAVNLSTEIVKQEAKHYNNGWIPCSKQMPPQPEENEYFEGKRLELYLVSINEWCYPFRAFWNGKFFTDGWEKINVIAWQPLPEPYRESSGAV